MKSLNDTIEITITIGKTDIGDLNKRIRRATLDVKVVFEKSKSS